MEVTGGTFLRTQLEERKQKLEAAMATSAQNAALGGLLKEVDTALEKMEKGTYGLCDACHESIEQDRLLADPLTCYCLDHLTREQQRALESDLQMAARIQRNLLPPPEMQAGSWLVRYHYEPAGVVSGDFCDLVVSNNGDGSLFFCLGDVAGKGVAAAMLMTHLHAMFRSLVRVGQPLDQLLGIANRMFCESVMAGQYATLVCGRAHPSGKTEISNAGHCPVLLVKKNQVSEIAATGMPLGMFCNTQFGVHKARLEPGDTLLLYTDGLSESRNADGQEYGPQRLAGLIGSNHTLPPEALLGTCLQDRKSFAGSAPKSDDLTLMVIRRTQ